MEHINDFIVEINTHFYQKVQSGEVVFDVPYKSGNHNDVLPKHGKVVSSPDPTIKKGNTVFFLHFNLLYLNEKTGTATINIPKEEIFGYCHSFPENFNESKTKIIKPKPYGSWMVGSFVESQESKDSREMYKKNGIMVSVKQKFLDQMYMIEHDHKEQGVSKNDCVLFWRNSEIPIDYLGYIFLRSEYAVYNKSRAVMLNDYMLVGIDAESHEIIEKNGVLSPAGLVMPINVGLVLKANKNRPNVNAGDRIVFNLKASQSTPIGSKVKAVPYRHLIGAL